ncbi:hypothetical protein PV328_001006 [Microctonus aethiopoides]|uniref:Uncharacterized protein n=1 Tax=Microctonus aethiopoides TaxID=144406 RepID=A0AA39FWE9_9HYME|nr:hypothetical protein PV328_001006 [Microctonus aethiopoides]
MVKDAEFSEKIYHTEVLVCFLGYYVFLKENPNFLSWNLILWSKIRKFCLDHFSQLLHDDAVIVKKAITHENFENIAFPQQLHIIGLLRVRDIENIIREFNWYKFQLTNPSTNVATEIGITNFNTKIEFVQICSGTINEKNV